MEKPWSCLEKFPTGGPLGPRTVPRKSMNPPSRFSLDKPLAASLARPLGFLASGLAWNTASGLPTKNPLGIFRLSLRTVWKRLLKIRGALSWGNSYSTLPQGFSTVAQTTNFMSVRAPEEFFEGKPKAAKPRGRSLQDFAAEGLPSENPEGAFTLPRSTV